MKPAVLLACLLWLGVAAAPRAQTAAATPPTPEAPPITAEQALAAWDAFRSAPEQRLDAATTFLKFMQGGTVHTVLRTDVLFWMYAPYPRDVQAVLYAAYMGGNMDSQLRGRKDGDDPEAGMAAALDAWAGLRKTRPDLKIERLDQLQAARQAGRLGAALNEPPPAAKP